MLDPPHVRPNVRHTVRPHVRHTVRPHVRLTVRPHVRPSSATQDDPVSIRLASDKHGDKKTQHGCFVDDLEITYRDVVACVRDIYSRDWRPS